VNGGRSGTVASVRDSALKAHAHLTVGTSLRALHLYDTSFIVEITVNRMVKRLVLH